MRLLLPFSFPDKHHSQLLLLHCELLFGFLRFESLGILDHGCCQRSVSWRKSRLDRMSRKLGFPGHVSHLFQKRKTIVCSIWTEGKLDALTRHLLRSKLVWGKCRGCKSWIAANFSRCTNVLNIRSQVLNLSFKQVQPVWLLYYLAYPMICRNLAAWKKLVKTSVNHSAQLPSGLLSVAPPLKYLNIFKAVETWCGVLLYMHWSSSIKADLLHVLVCVCV